LNNTGPYIRKVHAWKVVLIPFAWLYGLVIWIRNSLYDHGFFKSVAFNIPLISVGNISVGGTGKTPHVEYLAGLLKEKFNVATLSRGYKRKTRDFRIVSADSTVSETGDEPLQIKRRYPAITVAVDLKRVHGVKELMKRTPPVEVILLDDAFQHRSLKPGLSILLMDFARPIHRDRLLPAGLLREPASNRSRANIILVTRTPESIQAIERREYVNRMGLALGQHLYFTSMQYGELRPVYSGSPGRNAAWFKEKAGGILLVSGIANPRSLRKYALSIHGNLTELAFPDHHQYSGKDMERISRTYLKLKEQHREILVLTTDKDAVRLQEKEPAPELRDALYAVPIQVHFLNDDKDEFDRQIVNYVKSNKRSSIPYQGEDS
jgi:tetraacyldisaccharide 4'-kinase